MANGEGGVINIKLALNMFRQASVVFCLVYIWYLIGIFSILLIFLVLNWYF